MKEALLTVLSSFRKLFAWFFFFLKEIFYNFSCNCNQQYLYLVYIPPALLKVMLQFQTGHKTENLSYTMVVCIHSSHLKQSFTTLWLPIQSFTNLFAILLLFIPSSWSVSLWQPFVLWLPHLLLNVISLTHQFCWLCVLMLIPSFCLFPFHTSFHCIFSLHPVWEGSYTCMKIF